VDGLSEFIGKFPVSGSMTTRLELFFALLSEGRRDGIDLVMTDPIATA